MSSTAGKSKSRTITEAGCLTERDFVRAEDTLRHGRALYAALKATKLNTGHPASHLQLSADVNYWLEYARKSATNVLAPARTLEILDLYDAIFSLEYGNPTPEPLYTDMLRRAFEAKIRGDEAISEATLYRAIATGQHRGNSFCLSDRPRLWQSLALDRWYRATRRRGRFPNLNPAEAESRMRILVSSDLSLLTSEQSSYKRRLRNSNTI